MSATRRLHTFPPATALLADGIASIREQFDLPGNFPPDVEAAAEDAAAHPQLPDEDRTDLPLVTVDPAGAMDLDQAMHLERTASGYRVYYAIADVAAFVSPGDAIDREAHRRGETLYGADARVPLHPKVISEDVASLLPGKSRPAVLWTIDLDRDGEGVAMDVRRALVRSRGRFDYGELQARIDAGHAGSVWAVLREVGELRIERERRRGGISLPLPEQEIRVEQGQWQLEFRGRHPVEDWNEQISLLTGMAAATLMIEARVGLLRTLPPPSDHAIARLRRAAKALGIDWPGSLSYPQFIRTLDPARPRDIAMMTSCTAVLRGAGYATFEGQLPADPMHSALASPYTHATAPLRRLVDRYTSETCLALSAGRPVPDWVLLAMPALPGTMADSSRRAGRFERAVIDLAEAVHLRPHIGEHFQGVIVELDRRNDREGVVMLHEPAIEARVTGHRPLPLGARVGVQLAEADPATRRIAFRLQHDHD